MLPQSASTQNAVRGHVLHKVRRTPACRSMSRSWKAKLSWVAWRAGPRRPFEQGGGQHEGGEDPEQHGGQGKSCPATTCLRGRGTWRMRTNPTSSTSTSGTCGTRSTARSGCGPSRLSAAPGTGWPRPRGYARGSAIHASAPPSGKLPAAAAPWCAVAMAATRDRPSPLPASRDGFPRLKRWNARSAMSSAKPLP